MSAHILVVDLEATCDRTGWSHDLSEIIEIGAVLVDDRSLSAVDAFQTFVQPVAHPTLTRFCTELTSITQAQVDAAPRFPEAMVRLRCWLDGRSALFASWGVYDKNQLRRDAHRHGVKLPLGKGHVDLKRAFAARVGKPPMGMAGALRLVGLPLEGTHHRGIDDATNIARLLPWALGRVPLSRRG